MAISRLAEPGHTPVPYRVCSDPDIYTLEQQKILLGPVWHFISLASEIATPGDYKISWIGDQAGFMRRIVILESRRIGTRLVIPL